VNRGVTSHQPFKPPQEVKTREIYADHIFDLFTFAMKTLPEENTFVSALTQEQTALVRQLKVLVNDKSDKETAVALVKDLAWAFITTEYKLDGSNKFKDPVMQYLIGASLNSKGSLKRCREITSIVAALQYFFRLFVFEHCLEKSKLDGKAIVE
jgi:hypothetical protein